MRLSIAPNDWAVGTRVSCGLRALKIVARLEVFCRRQSSTATELGVKEPLPILIVAA
jgi:hypothetical protein